MTVVASNYDRKENDLCQTEPWATEALIRHFSVNGKTAWEPSAGNHLIADVLSENGAHVLTTDIVKYDRDHDGIYDFFHEDDWFAPDECRSVDAIITNPPYGPGNRLAVKYAEVALRSCPGFVALLLTAKFDFGKTRKHLFRDNPRFTAKIALLDRVQWFPGDSSGTEDHAWYVWTRGRPTGGPVMLYGERNPR